MWLKDIFMHIKRVIITRWAVSTHTIQIYFYHGKAAGNFLDILKERAL